MAIRRAVPFQSIRSTWPETARIVEVGARDGLQNEKQMVTTAQKIELINRCEALEEARS